MVCSIIGGFMHVALYGGWIVSSPKFQVGEEVIVVSRVISPGNQLEYTIIYSDYSDRPQIGRSGHVFDAGWCYQLDDDYWAHETQLRKKHKPSDKSFDEIMSSIKKGVTV